MHLDRLGVNAVSFVVQASKLSYLTHLAFEDCNRPHRVNSIRGNRESERANDEAIRTEHKEGKQFFRCVIWKQRYLSYIKSMLMSYR